MPEVKPWIERVRRVDPPDLWDDIELRSRGPLQESSDDRRVLRVAAVSVAAIVVIGAALYGLRDLGGGSPTASGPGSPVRYDVGGAPQPIAVGEGAAWVDVTSVGRRGTGPSTIWRIDPVTGETKALPATTGAVWVAAGEGAAWATCNVESCGGPAVLQLDAETGDLRNTIPLPGRQPGGITTGLGAVWVTTEAGLVKINADSASVVDTFSSARGSLVATAGGRVWVAAGNEVVGLDPNTGQEVARVPFKDPCTLASSTDAVYIASCMGATRSHDELVGVDASNGSVLFATRRDGWGPMDVVDGSVVVAQHDPTPNGDAIALVSFDAQTGHQLGQPFVVQRGRLKPEAMLPLSVTPMMMAADQGSVWVTDFTAEQVIRVDLPIAAPASQSASGSSPVASSWSSSTPFAPQPTDGQLPATFPDGTRVSLSMSDWSGMEEVVPFAAVYPVGGCGGSVLFGWDGLRDGVVDPTTEMRLEPPAESAVVFQGRGGWQPYYIALSADQWTALIPCSTSDSANAVASAQTIAKNVSLKVVDGWPVLSATDPVKLSSLSDEGSAPSLMFRFESKTYLQVRPIHACLERGAVGSAGVTQWCVRDAASNTVVLASAEGADSVVQRLINELGVEAAA